MEKVKKGSQIPRVSWCSGGGQGGRCSRKKVNRAESHISQMLSTDRAGSWLVLSMVFIE